MADDDKDQESKTEDPTSKRLEEAREKGNVPTSREVGSFLMLMVLAFTLVLFMPSIFRNTSRLLAPFISDVDSMATDINSIGHLLRDVAFGSLLILAAPLLASVLAALASGFLQNGLLISSESLVPKLSKISPMAGLKRLFSLRSLVEFIKNITKISVVGIVAYVSVKADLSHLVQLPDGTTQGLLVFLAALAERMLIGVLIVMFLIALLDLMYQRWQYSKSLRMTKQEIKDEYKQSEGDPVIKGRLRRLRMERARNRMMQNVPKADVIITNPTHFAVALQYDTTSMRAPVVVAKGQDLVAFRIRDLAKEHNVPVVENPPLARALFASTEIDQEIPIAQYEAVAKVISYVYQLKGKKPMRRPGT